MSTPTKETEGLAVIDRIIKEATEQNKLAGLVIYAPIFEAKLTTAPPPVQAVGDKILDGAELVYHGVKVRLYSRIKSFDMAEVHYEGKV